jgi:hypothetical protein
MATLEDEHLFRAARARPREQHVFVSRGGRRQRLLRAGGLGAGALALAWLTALGLAMAGSTRLPGLPAPAAADATPARPASDTASASRSHTGVVSRRPSSAVASRPVQTRPSRGAAVEADATAPTAPTPVLPASRPAPAASFAPAAPPAQARVTPQQGWARNGWTAPPGQTKRNEPIPRGRGHSVGATATTTTHGNGHGKG